MPANTVSICGFGVRHAKSEKANNQALKMARMIY